ncbi:MAG: P-II family nitrogen regulator [Candidatus Omnitrophica bacterium]|nr:P-II family nitrogen regulator [Candidatus Omnitrophota bacterium]
MKKIECVIRTEGLKNLIDALRHSGVGGVTISEVKGFGRETTRPDAYLILPKTKVEIYATDEQAEELIPVIIKTCRTGELGDGKIAILPMDDGIRIRTGERSEEAIL